MARHNRIWSFKRRSKKANKGRVPTKGRDRNQKKKSSNVLR